MVGPELIVEAEDAMGAWFGGVKVVFGAFEGSEVFNREVFWEVFNGKVGKIVGHSIENWGSVLRVFIHGGDSAD